MSLSIFKDIVDIYGDIKDLLSQMYEVAQETQRLEAEKEEHYSRDDMYDDLDEDTHALLVELIQSKDSVMDFEISVVEDIDLMISLARRMHKVSKEDLPALLDAFISTAIEFKKNLPAAARHLNVIEDTDDMEQALQDLKFWFQSQEVE